MCLSAESLPKPAAGLEEVSRGDFKVAFSRLALDPGDKPPVRTSTCIYAQSSNDTTVFQGVYMLRES